MSQPQASVEFVTHWGRHARQVYSYIYSLLGNRADADDVLQDTCITLIEKFAQFDPDTSFSAWACRVAYYKSLNFIQLRRGHVHLDGEVLAALDATLSRSHDDDDARFEALTRCIAQLPAKDREILDLRHRSEVPIEALAEQLGRTTSAIYKALARIRSALRSCVRRRLEREAQP